MHKHSKNRRKTRTRTRRRTRTRTRRRGGGWWPFTKKVQTQLSTKVNIPTKDNENIFEQQHPSWYDEKYKQGIPSYDKINYLHNLDPTLSKQEKDDKNENAFYELKKQQKYGKEYTNDLKKYEDNKQQQQQYFNYDNEDNVRNREDHIYNPRHDYNSDFSGSGRRRKRTLRLKRVFF
jgi:hypothetical protein